MDINAEKVLPLPVGAVIRRFLPSLISLNENFCGGVSSLYLLLNQSLRCSLRHPRLSESVKGVEKYCIIKHYPKYSLFQIIFYMLQYK